jgi:hypothetical protein
VQAEVALLGREDDGDEAAVTAAVAETGKLA